MLILEIILTSNCMEMSIKVKKILIISLGICFFVLSMVTVFYMRFIVNKEIVKDNQIVLEPKYFDTGTVCSLLSEEEMIGFWDFRDLSGELPNSRIILHDDKTFTLEGWGRDDFMSKGIWEYDYLSNVLILDFRDNVSYWRDFLNEDEADFEGVEYVNVRETVISLEVFYTEDPNSKICSLSLDLFGSIFNRRVK